jgi:hypothetical protein
MYSSGSSRVDSGPVLLGEIAEEIDEPKLAETVGLLR